MFQRVQCDPQTSGYIFSGNIEPIGPFLQFVSLIFSSMFFLMWLMRPYFERPASHFEFKTLDLDKGRWAWLFVDFELKLYWKTLYAL